MIRLIPRMTIPLLVEYKSSNHVFSLREDAQPHGQEESSINEVSQKRKKKVSLDMVHNLALEREKNKGQLIPLTAMTGISCFMRTMIQKYAKICMPNPTLYLVLFTFGITASIPLYGLDVSIRQYPPPMVSSRSFSANPLALLPRYSARTFDENTWEDGYTSHTQSPRPRL